jgi:hypothetical protein
MLSISGGKSAGSMADYLEKECKELAEAGQGKETGQEGYFAKDDGVWFGKGAEALGLSGKVNFDEMRAVEAGLNPKDTSETLVAVTGGLKVPPRWRFENVFSSAFGFSS